MSEKSSTINVGNQAGSIRLSKDLFVETIGKIREQADHDKKCGRAFATILPNDFVSSYDNHRIVNQLVKILKIALGDDHNYSWIDYFLWELDFGKDYKAGCATDSDGTNIDLSDAGKLWEFLINKNYKSKK